MTEIDSFQLIRKDPADGDPYREPQCEVVHRGRPLGLTIAGARLEAQFEVNRGSYVLLVTDDTPYEETLRAYLLDGDGRIIDRTRLGYAYTAGVLRDIQIVGERSVVFAFTSEARFRLTVHARPQRFWNVSGGVGEAVRFLLGRRLELTRDPKHAQQEISK